MPEVNAVVVRRALAEFRLQVEESAVKVRAAISHQLRLGRVEHRDAILALQLGQKK